VLTPQLAGCQPAALREDIKSDDTSLVATDDNPPTEWNVSGTSSQAAPALVRLNHHRSQVYLHVF